MERLESRQLLSISATPIFVQDFNQPAGSLPSASTWKYDTGYDPNAAVNYVDNASVMSVVNDSAASDGKALAIRILRGANDGQGNPTFQSARINTSVDPVGGNLEYGRIEARIKLPGGPNGQGQGLWPAFWMLGANFPQVGWPNCGEIDIMENAGARPGTVQGSLHSGKYSGPRMDPTSYFNLPPGQSFYSAYHLFAVDWSPGSIRFSVDGHVYSTFLESSYSPTVWNFNGHGFYVILNIADGGGFGGPLGANSTFPQTMYVDYVKAFSLTGISAPTQLAARAITPGQINVSWQDQANDESGFILQRSASSKFTTINATFNLTQGATTYQDTTVSPGVTYYYRLQAISADGTRSYHSTYSNTASAATWGDHNINARSGSGKAANDIFTLTSQSGGIGGAADGLNLLSGPLAGSGALIAQLDSLSGSGAAAAGLMIRGSTAANAPFADVALAPKHGVEFQYRLSAGSNAVTVTAPAVAAPIWLELIRSGNVFTAEYSTDDLKWTVLGKPQTLVMPTTVQAGLADTSGSVSSTSTAVFSDVSVGPVLAKAALALNAGGGAEGSYAADAGFSTGTLTSQNNVATDTTGVPNPAPQAVYQSNRYGNNFTYTLGGLKPGAAYAVQLQFAEAYWMSAGKRIFNVAINGTTVLSNFDIFAAAGGANKAVEEDFSAIADGNGVITLAFTSDADNAQINGIEVIPG